MAAYDVAIEDYLECPVCMETFNDAKYLKCLHTFCTKCVENLARGGSEITCPVCRQVTVIDRKSGTSTLKSNILVNRMVEALQNKNVTTSNDFTKGKDPVCKKHRPIRKNYFCKKCQEFICSECVMEDHKKHPSKVSSVKKIVSANTQTMKQILSDSITKQRQHTEIIRDLPKKYPTGHPHVKMSLNEGKIKFDQLFISLEILMHKFDRQIQEVMEVEKKKADEFSKSCKRGWDLLAQGNEEEIITNFQQWSEEMKANDLRFSTISSMDMMEGESRTIEDTARSCLIHLRKLESVLSELQAREVFASRAHDDAAGEWSQETGLSPLERHRLNSSPSPSALKS
ncbi:uncharacterized protein [Diadema setosum]|uniref:uncharacterized protein n=1 Tax=Diadema setosum TaxID=31175 RepID=UPI003B3B8B02